MTDSPPDDPRATLVANERVKITATMLNNAAVAAFVTSIVAPGATALYGAILPKSPYWLWFGLCWVATAAALHVGARVTLRDLQP